MKLTLREYATIVASTHPSTENNSLDYAEVSISAFQHLYQLNQDLSARGKAFLSMGSHPQELKLQHYVGVVETPCGTELEILPKHVHCSSNAPQARQILIRMLSKVLNLPYKESGTASLASFQIPLTEWFMSQFLEALSQLYKIGIRFDYQRVEEEQAYLRGQLNTVQQMLKPITRQHRMSIRHDIYSANRAENRLIRRCIDVICKKTQVNANWRKAHEFHLLLQQVPASSQISLDFKQWKSDRLMAHYADIQYWCQIILGDEIPFSVKGSAQGKSMLFPMERIFEKYVEIQLSQQLCEGSKLKAQTRNKYLATLLDARPKPIFNLVPDLSIEFYCEQNRATKHLILDSKWKLLNQNLTPSAGVQQSDLYQMFAYNHMYQAHAADIVLIYPKHAGFDQALSPLSLNVQTSFLSGSEPPKLWILPFNLDTGRLECGNANIAGLKLGSGRNAMWHA